MTLIGCTTKEAPVITSDTGKTVYSYPRRTVLANFHQQVDLNTQILVAHFSRFPRLTEYLRLVYVSQKLH